MMTRLFLVLSLALATAAQAGNVVVTVVQAPAVAAAPTFGAENTRFTVASGDPRTFNYGGSISAGTLVVIPFGCEPGTQTITSVTDNASNTYTVSTPFNGYSGRPIVFAYCVLTNPVTASNVVTIDLGSSSRVFGAVLTITGATTVDVSKTANNYSASITGSSATTTAASVCVGMIIKDGATYGSSNWTQSGASISYASAYSFILYKEVAAGSQDPAGSWTGNESWGLVWFAFK